jgi:hypothetical protein
MPFDAIRHTTNSSPSHSDRVSRICTAWSVACYCSDLEWTVLLSWKIDMSMNLQLVMKKSLQQNEGHLPLVPYCIEHRYKWPYTFLSSRCMWTHWPQHPETQTSLQEWKLNNIIRWKPKHYETETMSQEIWSYVQSTPNFYSTGS